MCFLNLRELEDVNEDWEQNLNSMIQVFRLSSSLQRFYLFHIYRLKGLNEGYLAFTKSDEFRGPVVFYDSNLEKEFHAEYSKWYDSVCADLKDVTKGRSLDQ